MALIEIRDPEGNRLAAADDLSVAIAQLVALCGRYKATVTAQQAELERWVRAEPDISATAPEHVAVFSAGWKACQSATWQQD